MTPEARQIAVRALSLYRNGEVGWTSNAMWRPHKRPSACLLGILGFAANGQVPNPATLTGDASRSPGLRAAILGAAALIRHLYPGRDVGWWPCCDDAEACRASGVIVAFNDHPDTTGEAVELVLAALAELGDGGEIEAHDIGERQRRYTVPDRRPQAPDTVPEEMPAAEPAREPDAVPALRVLPLRPAHDVRGQHVPGLPGVVVHLVHEQLLHPPADAQPAARCEAAAAHRPAGGRAGAGGQARRADHRRLRPGAVLGDRPGRPEHVLRG